MNYNLTVDEQKQLAGIMFNKLRAFDPNCILAGGAPRDWYFNKEATDLDFFLYQQSDRDTVRDIEVRLKSLGLKYKLRFANEIPHYEKNEGIRCVADIEEIGMPIQIVVMKKPTFWYCREFPIQYMPSLIYSRARYCCIKGLPTWC